VGAVTSLDVDDSSCAIAVGGRDGTLTTFRPPHEENWKVRLVDNSRSFLPNQQISPFTGTAFSQEPSIRCLLSVLITDKYGIQLPVLLLCSGDHAIHYYNQGQRIFTLWFPNRINTLCHGNFENNITIVAGCEDGFIYIVQDYTLRRYISVGHPITQLLPIKLEGHSIHSLLCVGHFNSLKVYHQSKLLIEHKTSDWIHTMSVGDVDNDGKEEIVVGLVSNLVQVFKVISQ